MTHPLSRRSLLAASLTGVPLLAAACEDGSQSTAQRAAPTIADVPPRAAAEGAEAAVPDAGGPQATPAPTPAPNVPQPRVRTIVLDPGHGLDEIGAASSIPGLPPLLEKDSNLAFARRLRELLEGDGYRVALTRETDARAFGFIAPANPAPGPGGMTLARADLQARVDWANNSGADLFLSLHSNDASAPDENGVEVWYCSDREVGAANGLWAQIVLENVLEALRGYGYRAADRGTKDDRYFRVRNGQNFHIFVLGPPNPTAFHPRATMMPAALVENLFLRHERDIRVLRDPAGREAITQGMRRAVARYFEVQGG